VSRDFLITDTARLLGDLLGRIPGLTADLNRAPPGAGPSGGQEDPERVTQLRLILSASELALLPFELAMAPAGFPGAGQPLSLQSEQPVCLTRGTRRLPEEVRMWPRRPRILFAWAAPPGYEAVPARAHLLALRRALEPWMVMRLETTPELRRAAVAMRLDVLPQATVATLEAACASGLYTHVHILAHGAEIRDEYDLRYGLALHADDAPGGAEVIDGKRLSSVLRAPLAGEPGRFTRPAVVTLATCNAANVGTVMGVGASIGHALHEAGVPLVVASQFPLSFGGSVMMVQDLYGGLLWGEDPRDLLVSLRRRLHARFGRRHDWASLTAYASLPNDFERQLASAAIQCAVESSMTGLAIADALSMRLSRYEATMRHGMDAGTEAAPPMPDERMPVALQERMDVSLARIAEARLRLERAQQAYPWETARIQRTLAGMHKREAQLRYLLIERNWWTEDAADSGAAARVVVTRLQEARALYWKAWVADRGAHWTLVQYVSLTVVLQHMGQAGDDDADGARDLVALWQAAAVQSLHDAASCDDDTRAWACGNLVELYLLAPLIERLPPPADGGSYARRAPEMARRIVAVQGPASFHVYSTRRQILRYGAWYQHMAGSLDAVLPIAEATLEELPDNPEPYWEY